jgi:short-subunit dehydrogenase
MSTWLITGASRGLGRQLARQLADRGHQVIACARDRSRIEALAADLPPGLIVPLQLDLADGAQIRPSVTAALDRVDRLDGVINNAGFGSYKPLLEHSESDLLAIIQVNLSAVIQICHAVLPRLIAQGHGHIVNIGSDLGRRPLANMAAYVAAKHGLAGFSHSLLREVKPAGIKVSLVNPGIIDTDFGGGTEGTREPSWSLRPADLARLIIQVIDQPGSTLVDELSVHPLGQDF